MVSISLQKQKDRRTYLQGGFERKIDTFVMLNGANRVASGPQPNRQIDIIINMTSRICSADSAQNNATVKYVAQDFDAHTTRGLYIKQTCRTCDVRI